MRSSSSPPIVSLVLCVVLLLLCTCAIVCASIRAERFASDDATPDDATPDDARPAISSISSMVSEMQTSFSPEQRQRLQRMFKHKDKAKEFVQGKSPFHAKLDTVFTNLTKAQAGHNAALRIMYRQRPLDTDDDHVVTLLWSGGVASTYRLCELLFVHRRTVRPVHLDIPDLDARTSAAQERETVQALDAYLRKHHTAYTDGTYATLLPTTMVIDIQPVTVQKEEHHAHTHETHQRLRKFYNSNYVSSFDVALVQLQGKCDTCDTHLSNRPIEVVLSEGGAHQRLYNVVTTKGKRYRPRAKRKPLAEWFGDVPPDTSPDERGICTTRTYVLGAPFEHLRFVTCPTDAEMSKTARKHGFARVLMRTWSCTQPKSGTAFRTRQNPSTDIPSSPCYTCTSCALRGSQGWLHPLVTVKDVEEEEEENAAAANGLLTYLSSLTAKS